MPTNSGSRWSIDYPIPGDSASQLRLSLDAIIQKAEAQGALVDRGAIASRPVSTGGSPGIVGRFYIASDESNKVYYDYGTGWLALASYDDTRFTKRPSFTWAYDEDTQLPGAGKVIARFYAPAGTLVKVRHSILSGSGSVVKLQKNGSDITGLTAITPSTSAADSTPSATTTAADDEIRLVCVTQGSGKGLAASVFVDF